MNPISNTIPPEGLARVAEIMASVPGGALLFTVVLFVLVLSILVFVHELGHYLAARQMGVKVLAFAIGFGRPLLKWNDKHGTEWRIGWLPLGGYVQLMGQTDLEATRKSKAKGHYMSKPVWRRAWIIIAGPLANLVLGFVVLWGAFMLGEQRPQAVIGSVISDMPAAGVLQVGDRILSLNTTPIEAWDDMLAGMNVLSQQSPLGVRVVMLEIERAGQIQKLLLAPKVIEVTDIFGQTHRAARLGVVPSGVVFEVAHTPLSAAHRALERTWELTSLTVRAIWKLLTGAIGTENLTGPLGIADLTGQSAQLGVYALLMLMAVVSINLCIVNLFPLPVLDGGHLLMLAYEALRGKPVAARVQEWGYRIGLSCIVGLAVLSTYQDARRFGWVEDAKPTVPSATGASTSSQP
jgi:regulator of sigma E protease